MIGKKILNASIDELKRRNMKRMAPNKYLERVARRANRAFITYFILLGGLTYFTYKSNSDFKEKISEDIKWEVKHEVDRATGQKSYVQNPSVIQYETIDTITKNIGKENKNLERSLEISSIYGKENDFLLYVNKNNNYADLVDVNNNEILYRFKTSDGRNQGVKERKADGRTPEGIYHIVNAEKSNNPFFGGYKIALDYPNKRDRELGRDGNGILICGPGNEYRERAILNGTDASNGGILLNNTDLKNLYDKIMEGRTLVVIEDEKRPIEGL